MNPLGHISPRAPSCVCGRRRVSGLLRGLALAAQKGAKMAPGGRPEAQGAPGRDAGAAREGARATQQSLCRERKSSPAT